MPALRIVERWEFSAWFLGTLSLLFFGGLITAWRMYPAENHFSFLTCTMSFLGSPDAHRNPDGWRYSQLGGSAGLLLFALLQARRAGTRFGRPKALVSSASVAFLIGLGCIFFSTWIPVSSERLWGTMTQTSIHNRLAIAGACALALGVVLDAISLLLGRGGRRWLILHVTLAGITTTGVTLVGFWRWKCASDPTLRAFPGEGIFSLPLWEWITFFGFGLFLVLQGAQLPRTQRDEKLKPES
jgi:hypothetical protein